MFDIAFGFSYDLNAAKFESSIKAFTNVQYSRGYSKISKRGIQGAIQMKHGSPLKSTLSLFFFFFSHKYLNKIQNILSNETRLIKTRFFFFY